MKHLKIPKRGTKNEKEETIQITKTTKTTESIEITKNKGDKTK